jgi:hypothetical protein
MKAQAAAGVDPKPGVVGFVQNQLDQFVYALPQLGSALLDMTVLRGAQQVLEAMGSKQYDRLMADWLKSAMAPALPGVLEQWTKARQVSIPDMTTEKLGKAGLNAAWQKVLNNVRGHNPFIDWQTAYPLTRDPLGQPVRRNAEGIPAWIYQLVDWTKTGTLPHDPVWQEIGRVFDATKDARTIPSMPDRSYTVPGTGNKVDLSAEQYERLMTEVGARRREYYERASRLPEYLNGTPERRAVILERVWSKGLEAGSKLWWNAEQQHSSELRKRVSEVQRQEGARRRAIMGELR